MEDIASLVRRALRDRGLSLREAEHLSELNGSRVSYATISKITKGNYKPGEKTLQGLAPVLLIPIEELRTAAAVDEPGTPFRLPDWSSRLSAEERAAVEHVARVMVEAKDERRQRGGGEHADGSAPIYQAAGSAATEDPDDYGLAADDSLHQSHHGQIGPDDIEHST